MRNKILILLAVNSFICAHNTLQAGEFSKPQVQNQRLSDYQKSWLYLSCGYSNLLSKNYQEAFNDYQNALDAVSDSYDPDLEFFISFGMSVICDNLHLTSNVFWNISKIRHLMNQEYNDDQEQQEHPCFQNNQGVVNNLRFIASMAYSTEVQNSLNSIVSEIFPYSSCSYFQHSFNSPSSTLFYKNDFKPMPCKSFWKKTERLSRRLTRAWDKFYKMYEELKQVLHDIQSVFSDSKPESHPPQTSV